MESNVAPLSCQDGKIQLNGVSRHHFTTEMVARTICHHLVAAFCDLANIYDNICTILSGTIYEYDTYNVYVRRVSGTIDDYDTCNILNT